MQNINNPLLTFENKWVALSSNGKRVLAAADSVKQLEKEVKKLKKSDIVFTWVPPFDRVLAPHTV